METAKSLWGANFISNPFMMIGMLPQPDASSVIMLARIRGNMLGYLSLIEIVEADVWKTTTRW